MPDTSKDAAVVELQKQIKDIVQELNLLKEQQALQTGEFSFRLAGNNSKMSRNIWLKVN